ncbi:hypothetical protein B0I35DRAFT_482787 [Stachybotrys elegans]|uniref:F-box domain-containing protein n=1 Tax=Stachybotrys elegans TaxID=80388 RepID=A0A8K0SLK9_9HYPO|nr:hypothetical protein B0I35DRAFT_482787 [Stachybotrys elegans]
MASSTQALGTAEILEQILLQADIRTVLTAQRVCQQWLHLIRTSRALQKHLFFQPDLALKTRMRNPLLAELFPNWFPDTPEFFNDLGLDHLPLVQPHRNAAFKYQGATWRRMLISQPPVTLFFCCTSTPTEVGGFQGLSEITQSSWTRLRFEDRHEDEELAMSMAPNDPITMERFYNLVVHHYGAKAWLLVWDGHDPENVLSRFLGVPPERRQIMERALKKQGLVMIRRRVVSSSLHPTQQRFPDEYIM